MIHWQELGEDETGVMVYQRIDEDGLVRVTAIRGYPELDAYLAQSTPDSEDMGVE